MSNQPGSKLVDPDALAGHRVVYNSMLGGLVSHISPATGVLDLKAAAPVLDFACENLRRLGFEQKQIDFLAAAALCDITDLRNATPEDFHA